MANNNFNGSNPDSPTQLRRLLYTLNCLNKGEGITAKKIADFDNTDIRTGYRVLNVFKDEFGDNIQKIGKEYKFVKMLYDNILDDNALRVYKIIEEANLLDNFVFGSGKKAKLDIEIKKVRNQSAYEFINKPLEPLTLNNHQILKILEHAIKNRRKVDIIYKKDEREIKYKESCPYKILFINENFYLLHKCGKLLQMARITSIADITELKEQFYADQDIINFIKNIQTPFSIFLKNDKKPIEVVLRIDKQKAEYFKIKNFFRSQKILQEYDNGDIEVSYTVTNLQEIQSFVLSWLPNIKIINPIELKIRVQNILNKAVKNI